MASTSNVDTTDKGGPRTILIFGGLLLECIVYAEVRQHAVARKPSRKAPDSLTRLMA